MPLIFKVFFYYIIFRAIEYGVIHIIKKLNNDKTETF